MMKLLLVAAGAGLGLVGMAAYCAEGAATTQPTTRAVATATAEPAGKAVAEPADNSYCLVCHANFQEEELVSKHQVAGTGCAKCHGESEKHSSDENGITPPEIMYPREKINPSCMVAGCHPNSEKFVKTKEHQPIIFNTPAERKICTECHGVQHRMNSRTRRWDKVTGKLIADDGVRMVEEKKK